MCLHIMLISVFVLTLVPLTINSADGSTEDSAVREHVRQFSSEAFGFLDQLVKSSAVQNAIDVAKFLNETIAVAPFALKAVSDLFSNFSAILANLPDEEGREFQIKVVNIRERFKQKDDKLKKIMQYPQLSATLNSYSYDREMLDKLRDLYMNMVDSPQSNVESFINACKSSSDPFVTMDWHRKHAKQGFQGVQLNEMYKWFSFLGEDVLDAATLKVVCVTLVSEVEEDKDEYGPGYLDHWVTTAMKFITEVIRAMKDRSITTQH